MSHYIDCEKRDLILSICSIEREIKIWDANKYDLIEAFNNIYKKGEIYSDCLLNDNNKTYILTTNFHQQNTIPIFVYDFNKTKIMNVSKSQNRYKKIDSFYNEKKKINYIIASNDTGIKSFDFTNNKFYNDYTDEIKGISSDFIINYTNEIVKLIELLKNGIINIWNFDSKELISKVKIGYNGLSCICEWVEDQILIGCEDNNIIIVDKNGQIKKTLKGHNNQVCCIKKIQHPTLGAYFISQNKGSGSIKLWN